MIRIIKQLLKKKNNSKSPKLKISPDSRKNKEIPCAVCSRKYKDTRSATQPDNMTRFFAVTKNFKGNLMRHDALCKPCYSSFFTKKRREKVEAELTNKIGKTLDEEMNDDVQSDDDVSILPKQKGKVRCKWVGEPLEKKSGKEYFKAAELEDIVYEIGDCARFKAPNDQRQFLGRIISFFQATEQMYVECKWYYFPDDIQINNIPFGAEEVFESNLKDTNSIGTIEGAAQVITEQEFIKLKNEGFIGDNVFYCKRFYDPRLMTLELL